MSTDTQKQPERIKEADTTEFFLSGLRARVSRRGTYWTGYVENRWYVDTTDRETAETNTRDALIHAVNEANKPTEQPVKMWAIRYDADNSLVAYVPRVWQGKELVDLINSDGGPFVSLSDQAEVVK
jgi:hypothetical protein